MTGLIVSGLFLLGVFLFTGGQLLIARNGERWAEEEDR